MKKLFFLLALTITLSTYAQSQETPYKVGYADTEYIMAQMPESKQLEEKLKETQTNLQNEFNTKSQEFQKQYANYTATVNLMSDTVRSKTEQQLQQLSAELQQFQQDAQSTLENTRKLFMAPIYLKIGKAIDEVASENNFSIILTRQISRVNLLLYVDQKMDVSELVLQKLGVVQTPVEK